MNEAICNQILGLRRELITVTAGAGGTGTVNQQLQTGRGFVRGFVVTINSATIADLAATTVNLVVNGVTLLDQVRATNFSPSFTDGWTERFVQAQTPGGVELDFQVVNGSGNAIICDVEPVYSQNKYDLYTKYQHVNS